MPAMFYPRHYRFLARALRKAYDAQTLATDRMIVHEVLDSLLRDLADENPFFSEQRFLEIFDEAESEKQK